MLRFESLHPATNAALFAVAAAVTWVLGTLLTHYSKVISDRLGGRQAIVGAVLLGGIVSLPEASTSISAAMIGNPELGVSTLLGGVAITMVMLAAVDAIRGSEPLTMDVARSVILFQGVLVILFLCVTASAIIVGDYSIPGVGVGVWTTFLLILYLYSLSIAGRNEKSQPWVPKLKVSRPESKDMISEKRRQLSNTALIIRTSAGGLAIILAGYVVAKTGDSLGRQTGVGSGMIGLILGGISTSLPELSTTLAAVRLRQYEMAFSEVFGTNLFSVMLLFFVDLAYPGNAILNETGSFEVFSVLLGIALTGIYLAGLIVRRNVTVVRMGVDSLLVILTYLGGVILLYGLGGRPI